MHLPAKHHWGNVWLMSLLETTLHAKKEEFYSVKEWKNTSYNYYQSVQIEGYNVALFKFSEFIVYSDLSLTDQPNNQLIDWPIDSGWLMVWLTDCQSDCLTVCLSDWLTVCLTDWLTDWLTDCSTTESWQNVQSYKPFSMFVMCTSNIVKQHRVNLFQTKLNDSIEHCKNKFIWLISYWK